MKVVLLLLGGAAGTAGRYYLSSFVYARVREPVFPIANLLVNVSGSFAIGVLSEWFSVRALVSPAVRVALISGLLGGYTTFSSFAFESFALLRDGEVALATLNVAASVVLGMAAVWAGIRLVQALA